VLIKVKEQLNLKVRNKLLLETEKFHVAGKKFNTSEEVIEYLKNQLNKDPKENLKTLQKVELKVLKQKQNPLILVGLSWII
jgi:hypothetical protein